MRMYIKSLHMGILSDIGLPELIRGVQIFRSLAD